MLLRVLEQRVARPVGGSENYPVRCRFIAAANQDLQAMTRAGSFRQDFYYRLNTFHLHIPPLRERRRDIAVLADYFLKHLAQQYGRDVTGIDPAAMNLLEACDWPGNVRQLRNAIERALIVCEGTRITPADLDAEVRGKAGTMPAANQTYQDAMQRFERSLLDNAITGADGNLSKAARQLDMKRTTLTYRVNQLGLRKARR
jgi:DNA-binding NtrC family response regulator